MGDAVKFEALDGDAAEGVSGLDGIQQL